MVCAWDQKSRSRYRHNTTAQSWRVQGPLESKLLAQSFRIRMERVQVHSATLLRRYPLPDTAISPSRRQYTGDARKFASYCARTVAGLEDRALFLNLHEDLTSPRRREHHYGTGQAVRESGDCIEICQTE